MSDRVDKTWHSRGIEKYSTAAVLGSLAHYGVSVTEESFLELCVEEFPLTIALGWHETWKGTGQFSRFPGAAAEELWRRLKGGEPAPTDVSLALVNLLGKLDGSLAQKATPFVPSEVEGLFSVAEGYLPRLPPTAHRRQKFVLAMMGAMGEWEDVFNEMAEVLAKKGQPVLADRLAALDEALIPMRRGISSALVKAAKGEVETAVAELTAIAGDAKRAPPDRLSAIDGLLELEQFDEVKRFSMELVDVAETSRDPDVASETVERLARLIDEDPDRADRDELMARVKKLAKAFEGGPE